MAYIYAVGIIQGGAQKKKFLKWTLTKRYKEWRASIFFENDDKERWQTVF